MDPVFSEISQGQLEAVATETQEDILTGIREMCQQGVFGSKQVKWIEAQDAFRLKVKTAHADHRVIFDIAENSSEVQIQTIKHRDHAYQNE